MGLIIWNSGLETGYSAIDAQHLTLLEAYNNLQSNLKQGKGKDDLEACLLALRERAIHHFSSEESLMEQGRYAGAQAHKRLHADLLAQLQDIIDRFRQDKTALTIPVMDFLGGWVVFHIKDEDARLVQFLKS